MLLFFTYSGAVFCAVSTPLTELRTAPFSRYHRCIFSALPQAVRRIPEEVLLIRRSCSCYAVLPHCDALSGVKADHIAGYLLDMVKVDYESSYRSVEGPAGKHRDDLLHALIEAVFSVRCYNVQLAPFLLDDLYVIDPDPGAL